MGADVVMTTSALLRHGIEHVGELFTGLERWVTARKLNSVAEIGGRMSHRNVADPATFARAHYLKTLYGYQQGR